mmetsp:Transcript_10963/g.25844  ORF Transcript_10963/g.25844 Transcript_10963/m.25844 type:complete len:525 (+) Transcript_10963:398-1972(+)
MDEEEHAAQILEEDGEANLGSEDDAIHGLHRPGAGRAAGLGRRKVQVPLGIHVHGLLQGKVEANVLALLPIVAPIVLGPGRLDEVHGIHSGTVEGTGNGIGLRPRRSVMAEHQHQLHRTHGVALVAPPVAGGHQLAEAPVQVEDARVLRRPQGPEGGKVVRRGEGAEGGWPGLPSRAGHGGVGPLPQSVEDAQRTERHLEVQIDDDHVTVVVVRVPLDDVIDHALAELGHPPDRRRLPVIVGLGGIVPVALPEDAVGRIVALHDVDDVPALDVVGPRLEGLPRPVPGIVLEHHDGHLVEEGEESLDVLPEGLDGADGVAGHDVDDHAVVGLAGVPDALEDGVDVLGIAAGQGVGRQGPPRRLFEAQGQGVVDHCSHGIGAAVRVEIFLDANPLQRFLDASRAVHAVLAPHARIPQPSRRDDLQLRLRRRQHGEEEGDAPDQRPLGPEGPSGVDFVAAPLHSGRQERPLQPRLLFLHARGAVPPPRRLRRRLLVSSSLLGIAVTIIRISIAVVVVVGRSFPMMGQ